MFQGGDGGGGGTGSTATCPSGLACNVQCPGGGTTSISGVVYDPAGKNPLYNVAVYVPERALEPLPKGVPTGSDACSCAALFKSGAVVSTVTGVHGSFKLKNAPVGAAVQVVAQVGKWRRQVTMNVASCQDNAAPTLRFPSTVTAEETNDNIPDIAVSTGNADTLECLMTRIGLPASEYVAGASGTGHVHVFSGGIANDNSNVGSAEDPPMPGAPASDQSLWDSPDHMMPYDLVLLSCEGDETYDAKPAALEQYLNAGGRAFASHYQYSWFSGPLESGQSYSAPTDWAKPCDLERGRQGQKRSDCWEHRADPQWIHHAVRERRRSLSVARGRQSPRNGRRRRRRARHFPTAVRCHRRRREHALSAVDHLGSVDDVPFVRHPG